jgi:hypothetical protein
MVHVSADDWAFTRRRATYLEAVLTQVLRSRERIQEWYTAADLAELRLPGLPGTKAGITRLAAASEWRRREQRGRGGVRFEYHCTSLPERAFEALISMILDCPEAVPEDFDAPAVPEIVPPPPPPLPENTAPPWVLPFMRLFKGGAQGDIGAAWRALPAYLPPGIAMPTEEEAAEAIVRLGLVKDG